MRKTDLIKIVWTNLWRMKVRTALTTFGVVIGTSAIVTMISIGAGMQKNITEQLVNMGSATELTVSPKYDFFTTGQNFEELEPENPLDDNALREIRKLKNVKGATPVVSLYGAEISMGRYSTQVSLTGMNPQYIQGSMKISKGRTLRPGDRNAVIVGSKVGQMLSEESKGNGNVLKLGRQTGEKDKNEDQMMLNQLNQPVSNVDLYRKHLTLKIEKMDMQGGMMEKALRVNVVGVLAETGQMEDSSIILPLDTIIMLNKWKEGGDKRKSSYDTVKVQIESPKSLEKVQQEIEELGFSTFSMKQMLGAVNQVFGIIEVLLGGIGSIALFVASFGIINTMIMSIYERTREIGIMKVIGATISDVRIMFLVEAGTIGFVGGAIGLSFGWVGSKIINFIANLYLKKGAAEFIELVHVPLWLALFALIFSTVVGLIAGVYPAMRAAKLSPLEAIRR